MQRTDRPSRVPPLSRGFTLIELIVAVAIIAVLVGAAVPVTSKILTYQARKSTREELQTLADASCEYFRDTKKLPADLEGLLVDPGVKGWSGPYLPGVVADQVTGLSGYQVDAWSREYDLSTSGDVLTIVSSAEDASFGDAGDLSIDVNVTWIRREDTLDKLKVINQAVVLYNGQYQATDPLPGTWGNALDKLVAKGFLPSSAEYANDGWGVAFAGDPVGKSPLVKVQSLTLSKLDAKGEAKKTDLEKKDDKANKDKKGKDDDKGKGNDDKNDKGKKGKN